MTQREKELIAALEFYANTDNYKPTLNDDEYPMQNGYPSPAFHMWCEVAFDKGERARETLEKWSK